MRPSFPKAELTMHLVEKYVTALKGARGLNLIDPPIIENPSFDDPDSQSQYRAYWRMQNR